MTLATHRALLLLGLLLPAIFAIAIEGPLSATSVLLTLSGLLAFLFLVVAKKWGESKGHIDYRDLRRSRAGLNILMYVGLGLFLASLIWFFLALAIVPRSFVGEEIAVIPFITLLIPGAMLIGFRFCLFMLDFLKNSDEP